MKSVFAALALHATTRPDAIAFQDEEKCVTWSELVDQVAKLTAKLTNAPMTVGIALVGGVDYVITDLAITLSGRRQVPLPFFFSQEQNAHILMDAKIGAVIAHDATLFASLPDLQIIDPAMTDGPKTALQDYLGGAERVIYTSGSSGNPKGVIIGDRQLNASLVALSQVIKATPDDRHLSIIPLPQLLEQICGIFLPILAGAETVFRFEATKALFGASIEPLSKAFEDVAPTTSLLAPALLGRWVADLSSKAQLAPQSLRFVAVGGASTAPALIDAAHNLGIPVYEGYGLSECCAVVAMNRPNDTCAGAGTVGRILDGLDVALIDGEIIVTGPTVMEGYLNGAPTPARWHTGDLGHFKDGHLVIDGRKDTLLITGAGRNISPEWVEQRVNADPRIVSSALCLRDDDSLVLIVATMAPITSLEISHTLADLPDYARPKEVIFLSPKEPGLLFPVGTPNRKIAKHLVNATNAQTLCISVS